MKNFGGKILALLFVVVGVGMEGLILYKFDQKCRQYPRWYSWTEENRQGIGEWITEQAVQYKLLAIMGVLLIIAGVITLAIVNSRHTQNIYVQNPVVQAAEMQNPVMQSPNMPVAGVQGYGVGVSNPQGNYGQAAFIYDTAQQNMPVNTNQVPYNRVEIELQNVEMIKAYKGLLDQGVISQEEFDRKKGEILGGNVSVGSVDIVPQDNQVTVV